MTSKIFYRLALLLPLGCIVLSELVRLVILLSAALKEYKIFGKVGDHLKIEMVGLPNPLYLLLWTNHWNTDLVNFVSLLLFLCLVVLIGLIFVGFALFVHYLLKKVGLMKEESL